MCLSQHRVICIFNLRYIFSSILFRCNIDGESAGYDSFGDRMKKLLVGLFSFLFLLLIPCCCCCCCCILCCCKNKKKRNVRKQRTSAVSSVPESPVSVIPYSPALPTPPPAVARPAYQPAGAQHSQPGKQGKKKKKGNKKVLFFIMGTLHILTL